MKIDVLSPGKQMITKNLMILKYGIWRVRLQRLIKENKIKYIGKGFVGNRVENLYKDPGIKIKKML